MLKCSGKNFPLFKYPLVYVKVVLKKALLVSYCLQCGFGIILCLFNEFCKLIAVFMPLYSRDHLLFLIKEPYLQWEVYSGERLVRQAGYNDDRSIATQARVTSVHGSSPPQIFACESL